MPKNHEGVPIEPEMAPVAQLDGATESLPSLPEGHIGMAEGLEEYKRTGTIPDGCPLSRLGALARDAIIEKHIEAQNDPNRKPTLRELLAAKAEAASKEAPVFVEKKDTTKAVEATKITETVVTPSVDIVEGTVEPTIIESRMNDRLFEVMQKTDEIVLQVTEQPLETVQTQEVTEQQQTQSYAIEPIVKEYELVQHDILSETKSDEIFIVAQDSVVDTLSEDILAPKTEVQGETTELSTVKARDSAIQSIIEQSDSTLVEAVAPEQGEESLFQLLTSELLRDENESSEILSKTELTNPANIHERPLHEHIQALPEEDRTVAAEVFDEITKLSIELAKSVDDTIDREADEKHLYILSQRLFKTLGFDVSEKSLQRIVQDLLEVSAKGITEQTSAELLNAAGTYEHRVSVASKLKIHLLAMADKKLQLMRNLSKYMLAGTVHQQLTT